MQEKLNIVLLQTNKVLEKYKFLINITYKIYIIIKIYIHQDNIATLTLWYLQPEHKKLIKKPNGKIR